MKSNIATSFKNPAKTNKINFFYYNLKHGAFLTLEKTQKNQK